MVEGFTIKMCKDDNQILREQLAPVCHGHFKDIQKVNGGPGRVHRMVDVKVHIFMSRPLVHLKRGCNMIRHKKEGAN